jgi:hypothetical protein
VSSAKIVDGTIIAADLATDSVTTTKIADGNVTLAKLAANSVDASKIVDGSITNADLANSSVSFGGVSVSLGGADATPAFDLADATNLPIGAGTTGTLAATRGGTGLTSYATGDLIYASAANTLSTLAAGTNSHVLTLAGGVPTWAAVPTGFITSLGAVGSSPNANGASVSTGVLTLQPADGTNPGVVTAGAQTLGGAKTFSSLLTAGAGLVSTGSATIQTATATDDQLVFTAFAGGAARFAGTFTSADLTAARTYTFPDANGEVSLLGQTIESGEITDGTIAAADLGTDSVTTAKITDANVTLAKLAGDSVSSAKIVDGTIATIDIANNAIDGTL